MRPREGSVRKRPAPSAARAVGKKDALIAKARSLGYTKASSRDTVAELEEIVALGEQKPRPDAPPPSRPSLFARALALTKRPMTVLIGIIFTGSGGGFLWNVYNDYQHDLASQRSALTAASEAVQTARKAEAHELSANVIAAAKTGVWKI